MSLGSWTIAIILVVLLAAAGVVAYLGWTSESGPPLPGWMYAMMALGIGFSLVIGIGLMALVFYSSRHGYDDQGRPEGE
jgi:formate hydrogenlyase subunit 3/multisubunit Na+/H+ antiporter MnhD subunit